EAARRGLHVSLAAAAHQEPHGRADAARLDEAEPERSGCGDRELRLQLAAHVGGGAELGAQLVDRACEAVPLGAQLFADPLVALNGGHSSAPPSSAWLPRSPAPEPAASPSRPP